MLGQMMENDYVMCFVIDESDRQRTDPRRIYSNINEHIKRVSMVFTSIGIFRMVLCTRDTLASLSSDKFIHT